MANKFFWCEIPGVYRLPMAGGTSPRDPQNPQGFDVDVPLPQLWLGGTMEPCVGEAQKTPTGTIPKKVGNPKTFLRNFCAASKENSSSFCYPRWYCKLPPNWRTLLRWFHDDRNTTLKFAGEGICRGIIDNCDTLVQTFWPRKIHQSKVSQLAMQSMTVLFWIGWKGSLDFLNLDFLLLISSEASGLKSTNPANVVEWQDFLLSPGGLLLRPNWHTWFVSSDLAMNSWNASFLRGFSKTES